MVQRYKLRQGKLRQDDDGEWVRVDEVERLRAIASVLADNLAHYRGRPVPDVMQVAEAVVREGEVDAAGATHDTVEQWVRLEKAAGRG